MASLTNHFSVMIFCVSNQKRGCFLGIVGSCLSFGDFFWSMAFSYSQGILCSFKGRVCELDRDDTNMTVPSHKCANISKEGNFHKEMIKIFNFLGKGGDFFFLISSLKHIRYHNYNFHKKTCPAHGHFNGRQLLIRDFR